MDRPIRKERRHDTGTVEMNTNCRSDAEGIQLGVPHAAYGCAANPLLWLNVLFETGRQVARSRIFRELACIQMESHRRLDKGFAVDEKRCSGRIVTGVAKLRNHNRSKYTENDHYNENLDKRESLLVMYLLWVLVHSFTNRSHGQLAN